MELAYVTKRASTAHATPFDNKLGGEPVFIDNSAPPSALIQCIRCTLPMQLLSQLNASTSTLQRVLYLFMCSSGECVSTGQGLRALRAVKPINAHIDTPTLLITPSEPVIATLLQEPCFGALDNSALDDIALLLFQRKTVQPQAKKKQVKRKTKVNAHIHDASIWQHGSHFASTLIDFYTEVNIKTSIKNIDAYAYELELLRAYQLETGDALPLSHVSSKQAGDIGDAYDEEAYETFGPSCVDKVMKRFFKRVTCDPECVMRFGFDAEPLLFKAIDERERCELCRGAMTFEYQIMPSVLSMLGKKKEECKAEQVTRESFMRKCQGMVDFATVIVMTCVDGCGSGEAVQYYEDVAIIQADSLY